MGDPLTPAEEKKADDKARKIQFDKLKELNIDVDPGTDLAGLNKILEDHDAKEKADKEAADKLAKEKADKEAADKLAKEKADKEAEDKKAADKEVFKKAQKQAADEKILNDNAAAAENAKKKKFPYFVKMGKAITTKKGVRADGEEIQAAWLGDGEKTLKQLIKDGFVAKG